LENRQLADQLDHPAVCLISARPDIFARQGYVAATYRRRNQKTFGPYYRLGYREHGRQRSVYLGREGGLVERVRRMLRALQRPRVERRAIGRLQKAIHASLQSHKNHLATLLRPFGLRLKGFEVRGWRFSSIRTLLPHHRRMPRISMRAATRNRRQNDAPAARLLRFLDARDRLRGLARENRAE
jgi:hypothetical protein